MIEQINLKNEMSDEDRLFYSPISTHKILIICKGNTCRSILFESVLIKKLKGGNYTIHSSGYDVKDEEISSNVINILNEKDIKASKLSPNSLSEHENKSFDTIILLDNNIDLLLIPESRVIREEFIKDPYGMEIEEYRKTFEEVNKIINRMF